MIQFNQVSKVYKNDTEAVRDFNLHITEGEFVTLIGPSGCGKTTTKKMINRLIEPTSGSIYIDKRNIKKYNIHELRWNIGYVLQEIALFPHLTIKENISIVTEQKKWSRKKVRKRSRELLEMVGLDPSTYEKKMPAELSGGEQQRIGVIRALAADPDIILMDEPFSALDPISREQLQQDIKSLQKEIKKTVVFVTHDMNEAMALGDKVCLMKDGQIVQYDTPNNLIFHPENKFVEQFIGEKKSPWLTAVDIITDRTNQFIIKGADWKQQIKQTKGLWVVKDDDDNFVNIFQNGKKIEASTLPNNIPLYKAVEILESSNQYVYPVLENDKLIGTLTYKDIVDYLKGHFKLENGVIQ